MRKPVLAICEQQKVQISLRIRAVASVAEQAGLSHTQSQTPEDSVFHDMAVIRLWHYSRKQK